MPTLAKSYQQIKDNPELLAILAEKVKGKGPGGSDLPLESAILTVPMDDNGAQAGDFDAEPAPGTMRTISENMVGSLSTAIPTGLGALAVGAATTALTKKPLAGMGAGMVAGPILGKYATGPLGRVINKKVLPDIVNRDVEIQQQVNPVASTVGSALANLALQKPTFGKSALSILKNPKVLTNPVDLGKLLSRDTTALESLKPLNLGAGIGGMAGTDIAMQAMEGQPIDWKRVGASAAMAPILGGGDFHGPIPKIVKNRIMRPIAERQMAAKAAEFNPVILKNPDGTLMDQETAKMYVLDLYDKDPTSQKFVEAKNELEQLTGYPLDIQNGLKWKKAVEERRAADAEKAKTPEQQVAELEHIQDTEQHPSEYLSWLGKRQFKNAKGEIITLNSKQRLAMAERDKTAGGQLRAKWEAEVAAAEAKKAEEVAAKGTKKPKTSKESVASPAVEPAPIERTPSSAPISAEAKNLLIFTKSLANRFQQTEITDIDLPILEGWAKEMMGNLPEDTKNQLWQEQFGGLVDALSKFPPEIARDKATVQKAWQTVLRLNRKQTPGQVGGMTTDGAQARQIAESEGRARIPDSDATRIDTENEPTPAPAPLSAVDEKATAELSEKPLPKLVPNKQGPKYDPAKPPVSVEVAINEMLERHISGELKNLDWDLVKAGVDKLPTKYEPDPNSPEGQAAWKAVHDAIRKAEQQNNLKKGELLDKDTHQVLTLAPWKFASDPVSAGAYAKRFANSLAKDIKAEGGMTLSGPDVQAIVDQNAKAPGRTLPVTGNEPTPDKIVSGEVPIKPDVVEEAGESVPAADDTVAAPVKPAPEAELIPFDLNNPEHARFEAMTQKVFGASADEHRSVTATDKYIPNPKGTPVKAGKSSIEGTGNILTADIPAGATIGKIYTPQKAEPTKSIQTSLGRYTNHSDTPNAEVAIVEIGKTPSGQPIQELVLKAKEPLAKGTELTVDYAQAKPLIEGYKKNLEVAGADTIEVKKGTAIKPKKTKKVKISAAAAPAKPTTAVVPDVLPGKSQELPAWAREEMVRRGLNPGRIFNDIDLNNPSVREAISLDPTLTDAQKAELLKSGSISPAATGTETTKPTVEPQPNVAAGEPTPSPAAQYKAIGDFVASVKELDALPQDVGAADLQAAQTKSKAAASILRESHGFSEDELNDLAKITYDKLDEHGGDVNKATEAAFKELVSSRVPTPGTPYKPAIKGDVGSVLGAVPEMYRATKNVTGQVYTKAKDYLGKINKGFQEGRSASDRPEFIRSSVIDTLRPGVLKMGLDKEGKYNGDELLGRLANTMHPVERQILMDNGLESFLKGERRSPEEVAKFMEENGPQIEVKKLFAHNAKVDEARQNIANLRHQIENLGYQIEGNRNEGVMYYRNGEEVPFKSMPKEHQKLVTEFEDAVPPNWERDPESATARYTIVNPKELSNMPGAVDILVRVPAPEDKPGYKGETLPYKYRSPHYPSEGKNLLAHVRGYMETLPDGRKVFHVFEVQSDWAQKNREYKQTAEVVPVEGGWAFKKSDGRITNDIINWRAEPFSTKEEAQAQLDRYVEANAPGDPLLKDYNRLALKAAIEHAYREGADAIAISDAETAMMTEGHDQNAANALAARVDLDELASSDVPGRVTISQEPGMRFNYDPNPATANRNGKPGALHELASELTKYPGEKVSFGEHKNAFGKRGGEPDVWQAAAQGIGPNDYLLRKNLIFKNPDGSPKTDITAQLYPIDKVAAKLDISPFAISGKGPKGMELYSFPGPLHTVVADIAKNTLKLGGKVAYKGTERFLEGAGERLSRTAGPSGGYFREHVRSFFRFERQLQNEFLEPVFKASDIGLTKAQREKVGKYAYDMDEYGASPIALSSDELKVYNLVRASFDSSRIAQMNDGPYQNGKPVSGPTKNFMPQSILSKEVRRVLNSTDRADYPAQKHYQELYEQWYRSKSPKRDSVSEADYVARIHDSLGELLGKDPFMGKKNPTFTPLYEHEGIGLPPSMRETDIIDVAGHYGRRWAAGLAWYRSVQKDPIMARIMGVEHNGRGADYVPATRDILPSDSNPQQYEIRDYSNIPEYARNLSGNPDLETYRAQMFRGATQHYDITDRLTAVANSAMLGPLTAFRDVVSSSLGSLGEVAKVSDIPAWTKAWGKVLAGESTALEAGAVRGRNTAEFAIDNSVRKIDGKIADVLRKYQGRDLMEKGIREVLFELGKEMASNRLASRSTNPSTITANNKFFETYGGKDWKKLSTEDLLDTVGSNVMEQMQGSFTPEYLPRVLSVGAGPSYTKAMFSLSRWGVERFRRYRQTVIKPIAEDGNILPLVKSTTLYLGLATPAVNALVEVLTHKKPKNSTWPEYLNLVKDGKPDAHLMDEFAYDFLANANLAGMSGILGGLIYQGMQLRHGERAMGYNSPGVSTLVDMGKRVIDYCEVYSGKDLFLNLWRLPTETALQEIQTLRLIKNALDDRPDTGNREEQIYNRVRGKTKFGLGDKATANPFSPLTAIRRASTVEDIMGQEPGLEKLYQRTNPEKAGRFHNPLRLPPSPEDAVAGENYYRFTTAMQTPEELANDPRGLSPASAGGKQLQRDAAQMGLNQVRAGVANVAWNRARARNLLERVRARGQ